VTPLDPEMTPSTPLEDAPDVLDAELEEAIDVLDGRKTAEEAHLLRARAAQRAPDGDSDPGTPLPRVDLVVRAPAEITAEQQKLVDNADEYADDSRAKSTRRAYASDWKTFTRWCAKNRVASLPATYATVRVYLAQMATPVQEPEEPEPKKPKKVSTISRAFAAILYHHRRASHPFDPKHPTITEVMEGVRNRHGVAPTKKRPLLDEDLLRAVEPLGDSLFDRRDRAFLCVCWIGAFRGSELLDLDVEDLTVVPRGYAALVRRSKTDQAAEGQIKAISRGRDPRTCPVQAIDAYLATAGITNGAIFRAVSRYGALGERLSDRGISRIVKRAAARAGLDPALFAGHSLRAGFVTTAYRKGRKVEQIMKQTGHKEYATVKGYVRVDDAFEDNAAVDLL